MKLKNIPSLLLASLKGLTLDLFIDLFETMRKPQTWSYVFYAVLILGGYYKSWKIFWIGTVAAIILYIVRKGKSPEFNKQLKEKAFLEGDDITKYYERYKTECKFKRMKPLDYEDFRQHEIIRIKTDNEDSSQQ